MSAKKLAAVVLFIGAVTTDPIVNPHGPTVVLDFTNCISTIVDENFIESGVLIVANYKNASSLLSRITAELLKRIHKKKTYTVEIKSTRNEVDVCNNYDESLSISHRDIFQVRPLGTYYIVIIDIFEDFPYLFSRLVKSRSWNPSAKFIVFLFNLSEEESNRKIVEKILSCLFKYNVINTVVIVPQANNVRKAIIYAWQPYDPPKYCGYFNETARDRVFMQNFCEKGNLKYKNRLFDDKMPKDMTGCVLYIIALERQPFVSRDENDANIEKILMNDVVKRYKLTTSYEIINSNRGERENDGQWNGALKELTYKKGQLLLGGIFPDFDVHEDFECSMSYLADSYTWVVPRAYQSPPWIALLIIFQKFVWYSVIAGYTICAVSWKILGQLSKDTPRNRSLKHCFFNAWICSLGFCAYLRPTKLSLRLFFVFFNIYCILVVTGYQTKLIDVLKNPTDEYQIQTIEELVKSGLKFGGGEELHDLFYNSSDPFDSYIFSNWIYVDNTSRAMVDVTVHRNFSLLCSRLELAHVSAIVPELSDSFGNFKYYAFRMNMFSVPMETVALRGFGYMDKISEGLSLFKQAGINEAVRREFKSFNTLRRARLLRSLLREKSDVNALSLQHLQGGFLVLVLGYASGTVVLVLEIVCNSNFIKLRFARRT